MKCNANTKSNVRCNKNVVSGKTIEVQGRLFYCCNVHFESLKDNAVLADFAVEGTPINKEEEVEITEAEENRQYIHENQGEEMTAEEFEDGVEMRQTWEMEVQTTGITLTFEEWMAQPEEDEVKAIRQITEQETEWIRPFVNLVLVTNHANKLWKKAFVARFTTLNAVGEIHNNDIYIGYVGHDDEKFVMVFESGSDEGIVPMAQFKQQKKAGSLEVELGGGKFKRYSDNWKGAMEFAKTVNATGVYNAKNGNGAWVYYIKEVK